MRSSLSGEGRFGNLFWLLVLGSVWGSSYLFIKVAVAEIPTLTLVGGRLLLAAVILWTLLLVLGHSIPRGWKLWRAYAFMGFFSGALPYSLIAWGETTIPSGLAALLQATMPLFTVILAHFLARDERLSAVKVLGVIVGLVGVGVLMLPDLRQGASANVLGQLAIVGSSVSYAAATVFARNELSKEPALVSTTGQITMGAVFMLPLSLLLDRPFDLSPSLPVLASWLGLVILGTVVAYVIYYALIERASATFVSTVTYIIPVNGLILGALVLAEPMNLNVWLSLGLILVGVLMVRR